MKVNSLYIYVVEAIWNSLSVDTNLCESMYKNYVKENGKEFPMMIGKRLFRFFVLFFFLNEFFDHILFCQSTLGQDLSVEQRIHLLMFLVSGLKFDIFLVIKGWLLTLLL